MTIQSSDKEILVKLADIREMMQFSASTSSNLLTRLSIKPAAEGRSRTQGVLLTGSDARRILEDRGYSFPKGKIISTLICKGGTGKSTTTFLLATRMAMLGAKVLVIDADPQGNLSTAFLAERGIELNGETPVLIDIMSGRLRHDEVIMPLYRNLHLIPSTPNNSVLDAAIRDNSKNTSLPIKKILDPIRDRYDFILIDCAPALNLTNATIIAASDLIVMPVNPDTFSEMSLEQTLDEIQAIEDDFAFKVNKKILFTKFDQREFTSIKYLTYFMETKRDLMFDTVIRTSTDPKNAIAKHENLFHYNRSAAKEDYDSLICELMGIKQTPKKTSRKKSEELHA